MKEAPGPADNPRILEYLKATNLGKDHWHDSTAHCAAFVCWVLEQAKLPNPRYAQARKFLHYGIALPEPRPGCLAVLWREKKDSPKGHVAFWVRNSAEQLVLFGANQRNEVREETYPKARLLGFRWPPGVPIPL